MKEFLQILERNFGSLQELTMKALSNDKELLGFLQTQEKAKQFFTHIDETLIFNKDDFLTFLKIHILDSSYTRFSNKIGLLSSGKLLKNSEEVVLNFPFKDGVLKGGQSRDDEKSNEIFFNEILGKDEIDVLFSKKALCNFEIIGGGGYSLKIA